MSHDISAPPGSPGHGPGPGEVVEFDAKEVRKIALSAFVGTALEWYDFFLFGTASAIVFSKLYFSGESEIVATMASFAVFGVGFLARPFGAILFGQLGDRMGRKPALLLSIVLIGVATGLVGFIPPYSSIGIWAPLLLTVLRLCQGIAVGGEWGGATTMAIEHAPAELRSRYAAMVQLGSPFGTLLSSGAFALVLLLPGESFDAWGWRIAFWLAFPMLGVALWIRMRVEESPVYEAMVREEDAPKANLKELFTLGFRSLSLATAASLLGIGGFFVMNTYVQSYATVVKGLDRQSVVNAVLVAAVCQIVVIIAMGRVSERTGPGKVIGWGSVATAVMAWPLWLMIDTGEVMWVTVAVCLGLALVTIPYAVSGALLSELFPPHHRYSGIAIGANIAGAISGLLPFIATAMNGDGSPSTWPAVIILIVISLITAVGGFVGENYRLEDAVTVKVAE